MLCSWTIEFPSIIRSVERPNFEVVPQAMAANPRQITLADLSFSTPQTSRKTFNKAFEFLLYKTNRLHFSVHVCVRACVL